MAPFLTPRRVEFADTDMAGIVHFSAYFRFMEAAEHAFLRACGLAVISEHDGEKVSFPRVAVSCDYRKPARFGDVLQIEVAVEKVGRSSIAYAITFHGPEGDVLATGKVAAVLCRVVPGQGMQTVEIPASMREALLRGPSGVPEP